jgi:hypothetical protein
MVTDSAGELAKRIEPAKGGDRGNAATGGRPPIGSRKSAGRDAGLSSHQLKQAIRVANVPKEEFERQVESQLALPVNISVCMCPAIFFTDSCGKE